MNACTQEGSKEYKSDKTNDATLLSNEKENSVFVLLTLKRFVRTYFCFSSEFNYKHSGAYLVNVMLGQYPYELGNVQVYDSKLIKFDCLLIPIYFVYYVTKIRLKIHFTMLVVHQHIY